MHKASEQYQLRMPASMRGRLTLAFYILALIFLHNNHALAQQYIGIEGGYSYAWEIQTRQPGGYPYEILGITGLPSGTVKGIYYSALSNILGMHVGLGYGIIGSRNNFAYPSEDYIERRFHVLYTEMAIAGQTPTHQAQIIGRIGIRLNYAVDLSEALIRDGKVEYKSHSDMFINRSHASAIVVAGFAYNISNSIRLTAIGEYSIGFTSLWQNDLFTNNGSIKRYPYALSGLIGIQYKI